MDLISHLRKNPFVLAPMAGITDVAFRTFMKSMGSSVVITELVSATGLKFNSKKTLDLMKFDETQHPIGVQIFGESLGDLAYAAKVVEDSGADFVDLNFGCPVPKVVKKGGGSAILKDLNKAQKIFRTVKSATNLPLTVKIRTGWDDQTKNATDLCNLAFNEGLTWVAIHGRTRAQAYKGSADWNYIKEVKQSTKIPVLGNGDICTAQQAVRRLTDSQCDGVMIGRGCLKNPWLFEEALDLLQKESELQEIKRERKKDFQNVFKQLDQCYSKYSSERIRTIQLKKLSSWYSAGLPSSASFRKNIFKHQNPDEVMTDIQSYFSNYDSSTIKSLNNEGFLMGGHG